MVKFKRPNFAKVGKVGHGHANAAKHKPLDLIAARSKIKVLTAHRKGSAGTVKLRKHTGKGLRAEFGLPTIRKGASR
jgi:hypothetical protein